MEYKNAKRILAWLFWSLHFISLNEKCPGMGGILYCVFWEITSGGYLKYCQREK